MSFILPDEILNLIFHYYYYDIFSSNKVFVNSIYDKITNNEMTSTDIFPMSIIKKDYYFINKLFFNTYFNKIYLYGCINYLKLKNKWYENVLMYKNSTIIKQIKIIKRYDYQI
jgi:hypothetical protein